MSEAGRKLRAMNADGETIEVPVTRQARVTLIGQIVVTGLGCLTVIGSREDAIAACNRLERGDLLVLRPSTDVGYQFRSGSACVVVAHGGSIVTTEHVMNAIPAACSQDYAYLVERQA